MRISCCNRTQIPCALRRPLGRSRDAVTACALLCVARVSEHDRCHRWPRIWSPRRPCRSRSPIPRRAPPRIDVAAPHSSWTTPSATSAPRVWQPSILADTPCRHRPCQDCPPRPWRSPSSTGRPTHEHPHRHHHRRVATGQGFPERSDTFEQLAIQDRYGQVIAGGHETSARAARIAERSRAPGDRSKASQ